MKYWVSQIKAGPNYKAVIYVVASKVDLMKKNKLSFVPHEVFPLPCSRSLPLADGFSCLLAVALGRKHKSLCKQTG